MGQSLSLTWSSLSWLRQLANATPGSTYNYLLLLKLHVHTTMSRTFINVGSILLLGRSVFYWLSYHPVQHQPPLKNNDVMSMSVSSERVSLNQAVPSNHWRQCQIPWDLSYRCLRVTMRVLGIEPGSSGRTASTPNHWAISPFFMIFNSA